MAAQVMQELNAQQREAVEYTEGPLLLIAGPGSGKTSVITHRIAHIVTAGLAEASEVLAVTFTKKAAGEMRERTRALLAGDSPNISTFHSFGARLLRRDGGPLAEIRPGFTRRFHIYDRPDQLVVMKNCYRALNLKEEYFIDREKALGVISRAKNRGQTPSMFLQEAAAADEKNQIIARVFEAYEAALLRENALDFDDLLGETVRLLRHDDATRRAWNQRLKYIMIDEFQDTNPGQYELMRLLTQRRDNVCVVGDDDQGIYSWRGATVKNIFDFKRDYPNARLIRLEQNYRSTQSIVAASKAVVENNSNRIHKELWTELPPGDSVGIHSASTVDGEAEFITGAVMRHMAANPEDRIAVLYRSNHLSRKIEQTMRRFGVKYKTVAGASFFGREEIKNVMAYLKLATDTSDSMSLLRIINTPARGIGKAAIEVIKEHAREKGLELWGAIERMAENPRSPVRLKSSLRTLCAVIADLSEAAGSLPVPDLVRSIFEQTGYKVMLEKLREVNPEEGQARLDNVQELIDMAAEAVERGETVDDFADYIALAGDTDVYDEKSPVSLMTLHAAKGLEFSLVFICGMEEGLFPHPFSTKAEALEEERRLFYVGMTRAKGLLILTRAEFRPHYGSGAWSRFLREVPHELRREWHFLRGSASLRAVP